MFMPTSAEVRRFFLEAWQLHRTNQPLEGASRMAAEVVARHPEFHPLFEALVGQREPENTVRREEGQPFLHLSLHLAVEEQLSIDQPPGIRAHYLSLLRKLGDEHGAQHILVECLAETLWNAQRENRPLDGQNYLERIALVANKPG